jgi:hypothetical protein
MVEVAVICGDETVGTKDSQTAWIKATVRSGMHVDVDWSGITLVSSGVKVVRRAAGRKVSIEADKYQRTVTYWAVATGADGVDSAQLGPVEVRYRTGGGGFQTFRHGKCPLQVVD